MSALVWLWAVPFTLLSALPAGANSKITGVNTNPKVPGIGVDSWGPDSLGIGFRCDSEVCDFSPAAGVLTVKDGGILTTRFVVAGYGPLSSGQVDIKGVDPLLPSMPSRWSAEEVYIGRFGGIGDVLIDDGASFRTQAVQVGVDVGSTGKVTVLGDAHWEANHGTSIGTLGKGTLTIGTGGEVLAHDLVFGWSFLPGDADGNGRVIGEGYGNISSTGALATTGQLWIGDQGVGYLTLENGGLGFAQGDTQIKQSHGLASALKVTDAGSRFEAEGGFYVGGLLEVLNGGQLSTRDASVIGRPGELPGKAAISDLGSSWTVGGLLRIGDRGTTVSNGRGELRVENQAALTGQNAEVANGTALVKDPGSSWKLSGTLDVGRSANDGRLIVESGGLLESQTGSVGTLGAGVAEVRGEGSLWRIASNLSVGATPGVSPVTDKAQLTAFGSGGVDVGGTLTIGRFGDVSARAGGVISADQIVVTDPAGSFQLVGGRLETTSFSGGTLMNAAGVFSPGKSPAITTVDAYVQSMGGILEIEIGGTDVGSTYDRLIVKNLIDLAGTLQIVTINGFTPSVGDRFDILDWGSLTGQFDTLAFAPLPAGMQWDSSQLYVDGSIGLESAPVPVPATVWLFGSGLVSLVGLARRRKA